MKQTVHCIKNCFKNENSRQYYVGDQDDIDPLEPIAMYFDGWKPGTEVYTKIRGTKTTPPKETTRVVPGAIESHTDTIKTEMCPDCGTGPWKNLSAHQRHCKGKE